MEKWQLKSATAVHCRQPQAPLPKQHHQQRCRMMGSSLAWDPKTHGTKLLWEAQWCVFAVFSPCTRQAQPLLPWSPMKCPSHYSSPTLRDCHSMQKLPFLESIGPTSCPGSWLATANSRDHHTPNVDWHGPYSRFKIF